MKKLYAGLFLAASSLPVGFIAGSLSFQYVLGTTWPSALQIIVKVTASMLGLGLFIFLGGLVTKVEAPKPAPNGEDWSKEGP
ncbi:hypothetical protein [Pseudomonas aeruginosa]|uniref:hypothetical protein n=1 Tax=Pseudomonas aeruginosa TaxID=287 RepID=UPI000FC3F902|nr:hypothetical protein [Pseudomonas aeruginosa]RUC69072.1 hypothetical protein IPC1380_23275 [Pseudomonas aeruginosa]